jgi:hypothetical protein
MPEVIRRQRKRSRIAPKRAFLTLHQKMILDWSKTIPLRELSGRIKKKYNVSISHTTLNQWLKEHLKVDKLRNIG